MGFFLSAVMTGHPQRLSAKGNHSKGEKWPLFFALPVPRRPVSTDLTSRSTSPAIQSAEFLKSPEFGTQEDPYWFWSITVYVDPQTEIVTSGKVQTFNEAKARFRTSWQKIVSGGRGEPPSPDGD
jgi:hypothetical protein